MPLLPIIAIVHALITTVASEIEVFLTADLTAALVTVVSIVVLGIAGLITSVMADLIALVIQDLEAEDSLAAADLDRAI